MKELREASHRVYSTRLERDRRIERGFIGSVEANEHSQGEEYWDDINGKKLDPELVGLARKEEIEEYRKHGVYEKVPIEECWEQAGKKPIRD